MKTEKECLCHEEVEAISDFNLQDTIVPIVLLELTHTLLVSIFISFCNQMWLEPLPSS